MSRNVNRNRNKVIVRNNTNSHNQPNKQTETNENSKRRGEYWISDQGKKYKPQTILQLPANRIICKIDYQRNIDKTRVKNIMEKFDISQLDPIKVNLREDGNYYLNDGQHRYCVLTNLFGDDVVISAVLLDQEESNRGGMTEEQFEAYTFAHQHDDTKQLTVGERFHAALIAGEQYAVNIWKICDNNEFEINYTGSNAKQNSIVCISRLIDIYNKPNGSTTLNETLRVLRAAYNGDARSLSTRFIKALSDFITKYKDHKNYSEQGLIKALQTRISDPEALIIKARAKVDEVKWKYKKTIKLDDTLVSLILAEYNYKKVNKIDE